MRWHKARKLGFRVYLSDHKIAGADDIHSDYHISAPVVKITADDRKFVKFNAAGQIDIYLVDLGHLQTANPEPHERLWIPDEEPPPK